MGKIKLREVNSTEVNSTKAKFNSTEVISNGDELNKLLQFITLAVVLSGVYGCESQKENSSGSEVLKTCQVAPSDYGPGFTSIYYKNLVHREKVDSNIDGFYSIDFVNQMLINYESSEKVLKDKLIVTKDGFIVEILDETDSFYLVNVKSPLFLERTTLDSHWISII